MLFFSFVLSAYSAVAQEDYKKTGYASYYHDKFDGRQTASGEIFRQKKLTCAHRTLPFGTTLKVVNLSNDKEVIVKVNDRGPYSKGRIIDLSKADAKELDFIREGHTKVSIEIISDTVTLEVSDSIVEIPLAYTLLSDSSPRNPKAYSIQVGSFKVEENMEKMVARVNLESDKPVFVRVKRDGDKNIYRVTVGSFKSRGEAFGYLHKIITSFRGAFIVELK